MTVPAQCGRTTRWLAALTVAAAVAVACTGCAGGAADEAEDAPAPEELGAPATLAPMPTEDKTALMPAGFPPEIPVLDATVLSTSEETVEGSSVWRYELSSGADPGSVAEWYRTAYAGANWSVAEDTAGADGGVLVFAKGNGIETVLTIEPADGGSAVRASVGFGVSLSGTA